MESVGQLARMRRVETGERQRGETREHTFSKSIIHDDGSCMLDDDRAVNLRRGVRSWGKWLKGIGGEDVEE